MTACTSDVGYEDGEPAQPSRTGFRMQPPPAPKPRFAHMGPDAVTGSSVQLLHGDGEPQVLESSPGGENRVESGELEGKPDSYKSSWQRWQCMPKFLEQQRQQLLEKPLQERTSKPPTKEALEFFESLLAGTEPSSATASGAAQVQSAARRLQRQAEAARRKRRNDPPAPADAPEAGSPGAVDREPEEAPEPGVYEQRDFLRRLEHQRKLQELEAAAERERRELLAQIQREQAETEARRNAQEEWREDLARKTQKKKEEAERDAWSKTRARASENYWRTRWFRYMPKAEAESGPKSNPRPPPRADGASAREEQRTHGSGPRTRPQRRCATPPPISWPVSAEGAQLIQELSDQRDEPLESRKRAWRALCLQWHPDKSEDKETATRVFQQLSELKPWFLPEA